MKKTTRNPKDQAALDRVPMWALPAIGAVHGAMACGDGVDKYGAYNWREEPILLMEYIGAIERHIAALKDGEWLTRDGGDLHITHLGCINANTAIILDAKQCGTLIDDRPTTPGQVGDIIEEYRSVRSASRSKRPANNRDDKSARGRKAAIPKRRRRAARDN